MEDRFDDDAVAHILRDIYRATPRSASLTAIDTRTGEVMTLEEWVRRNLDREQIVARITGLTT